MAGSAVRAMDSKCSVQSTPPLFFKCLRGHRLGMIGSFWTHKWTQFWTHYLTGAGPIEKKGTESLTRDLGRLDLFLNIGKDQLRHFEHSFGRIAIQNL